ncbi:MAG: hypothetical protein L0241_12225 [Planctomycetia bacterium]|nr:hypothetical protein [Planctomycetia bacterium]
MPFVEKTMDVRTENDQGLLAELIRELRSPRDSGQPLIEVRNMSRGGLRHVYVIWDRWDECRPEARTAIVRDAFTAVKGEEYEKSIAVTIPATVPEAVEMGLLPYEVKPFKWLGLKDELIQQARQALLAEGASVLRQQPLPTLRFATEQQAEDAVTRLKQAAPTFDWRIVETVSA